MPLFCVFLVFLIKLENERINMSLTFFKIPFGFLSLLLMSYIPVFKVVYFELIYSIQRPPSGHRDLLPVTKFDPLNFF